MKLTIIDLEFLGRKNAIASFLIETTAGPVLIETGPHSTLPHLQNELEGFGYSVSDIRHVFLTHIHLDHAGAAWAFAETGATIYLHPFGAKNMIDPSRLMESAKMIYKEDMDRLWGRMEKIDEDKIKIAEDKEVYKVGEIEFRALHTPGHAKHHIAWQVEDIIFTGDVAGVKIDDGPIVPPCPPPDIQIEDWNQSIDLILNEHPKSLYLTHFGKIEEIESHFDSLRKMLDEWSGFIRDEMIRGVDQKKMVEDFMSYTTRQLEDLGVSKETISRYDAANPAWMSVAGLVRYWNKFGNSEL